MNERDARLEAIRWWERRRWIYNLLVGLTGLGVSIAWGGLPILAALPLESLLVITAYGMAANCLYTLGWIVEIRRLVLGHDAGRSADLRAVLFLGGTVFSVVLTGVGAAYAVTAN